MGSMQLAHGRRQRWLLGAGLVAVVVAALVVPAAARRTSNSNKVLDRSDRRFNHADHSKAVVAKIGKDEPCGGKCHTMSADYSDWKRDADNKKEHERCYAGCHGGFKHRYTTDRGDLKGVTGRTCYPCHGTKLKYRPEGNSLGSIAGHTALDYVATFSHRKHTSSKATSGKQCESCHGKWGDERGAGQGKASLAAGHEYCSGCHAKAVEPAMTGCDGCHLDRNGAQGKTPVLKPRTPSLYAVGVAFSHKNHAQEERVGTQGRTCLACHANISASKDDFVIPLPTMQDCYNACHDGKKAFSVTGTQCGQCHRKK